MARNLVTNRFDLLKWVVVVWEPHVGLDGTISCLWETRNILGPDPGAKELNLSSQRQPAAQGLHACAAAPICPIGIVRPERGGKYLQCLLSTLLVGVALVAVPELNRIISQQGAPDLVGGLSHWRILQLPRCCTCVEENFGAHRICKPWDLVLLLLKKGN